MTNISIEAQLRAAQVELRWRDDERMPAAAPGRGPWKQLHAGIRAKPVGYIREKANGQWRAVTSDVGTIKDTEEEARIWTELEVRRLMAEMLTPAPNN